ncbi:MAG: zinc ABC transporter substrate-binding protein [Phycisphaerae bacterium]
MGWKCGASSISTESEAGIADINRLVEMICNRGIQAVFVETSVSDKNIKALLEGAKARDHQVSIGGTLFSDAMGNAGTYEGTYVECSITTSPRSPAHWAAKLKGMQGKTRRLRINACWETSFVTVQIARPPQV